jgi:hypothetical protein
MKFKYIFLFLLFITLSGCAHLKELGFRSYQNNFTNDLNRHTKSVTLYRDFTTIAIAQATHFNKRLMEEYITYTQRMDAVKAKKYHKLLSEFDQYDIYWLALYTPDDDINNLSSKDSFWNIYLSRNSATCSAVSIKEVGVNDMTKQWLYFVKANKWARQYIIKFKKDSKPSKNSRLVLSSFLGTIEILFNN